MPKLEFVAAAKVQKGPRPTLAALLREHGKLTWSRAQTLCERGKVSVDGEIELDYSRRISEGARVEVDERRAAPKLQTVPIVFEDAHIVVIDKPTGMSSVPYEKREAGTAMDAVRDAWRAEGRPASETALHVVHRIDKETSGLIAFAKSKLAERGLQGLFRTHDVERTYLCVAHGLLADRRVETRFIDDRGDGLRGSARVPNKGKRAVTHVRAVELLPDTTLCEIRLETGKTHQIRIHMSELGHPLVGEQVYVRDYARKVAEPIPSPRLMLHAATLGFVHPITGATISLTSALPPLFESTLATLRRRQRVVPIVKTIVTRPAARPAGRPAASGPRSSAGTVAAPPRPRR